MSHWLEYLHPQVLSLPTSNKREDPGTSLSGLFTSSFYMKTEWCNWKNLKSQGKWPLILLQFCWVLHNENHSSTTTTDNKYIRVNTTKQNMQISVPYLKQLSITLVLLLMSCFTWLYKLILYFNHTALLNGKMQSWILLILPLKISLVILLIVSHTIPVLLVQRIW